MQTTAYTFARTVALNGCSRQDCRAHCAHCHLSFALSLAVSLAFIRACTRTGASDVPPAVGRTFAHAVTIPPAFTVALSFSLFFQPSIALSLSLSLEFLFQRSLALSPLLSFSTSRKLVLALSLAFTRNVLRNLYACRGRGFPGQAPDESAFIF